MVTIEQVKKDAEQLIGSFAETVPLSAGQIVVIGCSTSEIAGEKIGTSSSMEIALAVLCALREILLPKGVYLAFQCCEHLNRAIIMERECAEKYGFEQVGVRPAMKAGGALATSAWDAFTNPVAVEYVQAHAGIDIGDTLIGMHLRHVAVPVRTGINRIGAANVVMAKTRPKYIGGPRAHYE